MICMGDTSVLCLCCVILRLITNAVAVNLNFSMMWLLPLFIVVTMICCSQDGISQCPRPLSSTDDELQPRGLQPQQSLHPRRAWPQPQVRQAGHLLL